MLPEFKTLSAFPSSTFMTVTKEMADYFLTKNPANRPVRRPAVRRYVEEIKDWMPTCEGIGFSTEDVLIDGQHRLMAISESGVPAVLLVVTGLSPKAFEKINRGQRRTAGDDIAIIAPHLKAQRNALSAITGYMLRGDDDQVEVDTSDVVEAAVGLSPIVLPLLSILHKNELVRPGFAAIVAAFAGACRTTDDFIGPKGGRRYDMVEAHARRLGSIQFTDDKDPMKTLYKRLVREKEEKRQSGSSSSKTVLYSCTVSALRAALAAKPLAKVEPTTIPWGAPGDTVRIGTAAVVRKVA